LSPSQSNLEQLVKLLAVGEYSNFYSFADGPTNGTGIPGLIAKEIMYKMMINENKKLKRWQNTPHSSANLYNYFDLISGTGIGGCAFCHFKQGSLQLIFTLQGNYFIKFESPSKL